MAKPLRPGTKTQLWSPDLGIRFSAAPSPSPRRNLGSPYPGLDMSRFFQTASHDTEADSTPSKELPDVAGAQINKDDPNRESVELSIERRLLRLSSPTIPPKQPLALKQLWEKVELSVEKTSSMRKVDVVPPSTSLSFNISHDLFYAARSAKEGSSNSFWSHTMYERKSADGTIEKVKVHYCTNSHTMERVCKEYFVNEKILGFDLEWFPFATRFDGARENVSVIQLASPDRIGLFHLAVFPTADDFTTPTFRKIMEDATVSKVGVQIRGDCRRLKNFLNLTAKGIFELSHLYKQVKFTEAKTPKLINKVLVSLATQVQDVLGLPLFKGDAVRSSNWMRRLNYQQILYSASDAYAGIQLYHVLEAKRKALHPTPERPYHIELGLPIPRAEPELVLEPGSEATHVDDPSYEVRSNDPQSEPLYTAVATSPQRKATRGPTKYQDNRVLAAEEKAAQYRASKDIVLARPRDLRSYYLWYTNQDLPPDEIAKLLRDPPLQTSTVLSYILDAISLENVPYDKERLKLELLPLLHEKVKQRRYRALLRSCEEGAGECQL